MKNYKAIIVEDEELPRLSLMQKLKTYHPDIAVVDTCADCETALDSMSKIGKSEQFQIGAIIT